MRDCRWRYPLAAVGNVFLYNRRVLFLLPLPPSLSLLLLCFTSRFFIFEIPNGKTAPLRISTYNLPSWKRHARARGSNTKSRGQCRVGESPICEIKIECARTMNMYKPDKISLVARGRARASAKKKWILGDRARIYKGRRIIQYTRRRVQHLRARALAVTLKYIRLTRGPLLLCPCA